MATIDLKYATVVIRDGTTTPNTLEISIGEGNLTYTEKREMQYRRNRGVLDTVRQGDEQPVEVSFDFEWEFLRSVSGDPVTVEEALKKIGAASGWTSSSVDPCEPYAVDIVITYVPPCGNAKDEVIVLQDFRWETLDHNLKDGQVSCKGQCNVTEALVTRVTHSAAPEPAAAPTARSARVALKRERIDKAIQEAVGVGTEREKDQE